MEGSKETVSARVKVTPIAHGWARTTVNVVPFRRDPLATFGRTQYAAFYDADARLVLARRALDGDRWDVRRAQYGGNAADAHNAISLAVDGAGRIHVAWDHHNVPLRYARSVRPESIELGGMEAMTGVREDHVTYPEFYPLPGGDLLFVYRDGMSGDGNLMINRWDCASGRWSVLRHDLIDGEGERNAYWQIATGADGAIHVSWCWRESPDVETNHDLCYARSRDGGATWEKSTGERYTLPITIANAEYALRIPQDSQYMNQTSMAVDCDGRPVVAGYWQPEGSDVPQYSVVYHDGAAWKRSQVGQRRQDCRFRTGRGTVQAPLARPRVLAGQDGRVHVAFRDAERGFRVSAATCDALGGQWRMADLTNDGYRYWEPACDTSLWLRDGLVHLLLQRAGQGPGGGQGEVEDMPPQMISVLEWRP